MSALQFAGLLILLGACMFAAAILVPAISQRRDEKRSRATEQGRINAILARRVAEIEGRQDHSARQLGDLLKDKAERVRAETLSAEPDETLTAILEEVKGLRADLARAATADNSYTITVTSLDGKTTTIKGVATPTRDNDAPDSLAALSRLVRQLRDDEVKKARRGAEDGR